MKHYLLAILLLWACVFAYAQESDYTVEKIWDNGMYNSFTSLIRYRGQMYCCFREGRGHVFDEHGKAEGKVRVLRSRDGHQWESIHYIGLEGRDLRDPKLCQMPDGRLMLYFVGPIYRDGENMVDQAPFVCFCTDGQTFSEPQECQMEAHADHVYDWPWRVTWYKGVGYTMNYFRDRNTKQQGLWLMTTRDGISYRKHSVVNVPEYPNECTIRFLKNGDMTVTVRRSGNGFWGVSKAPYLDWEWKELPTQLGGQDYQILNNKTAVMATRCYTPQGARTGVYIGDVRTGEFTQRYILPSGGDTSYPGIVVDGKYVWICYYAGHETHWPQIYMAKFKKKALTARP